MSSLFHTHPSTSSSIIPWPPPSSDFYPFSTHLYHLSSSLPGTLPLYHMEVETFAWIQSRRPLSFCPCWSPEGNITLPPLLAVVPGLPWQPSSPAVTGLSPCTVSYYPPPHWLCAIRLSRFPQNSAKSPSQSHCITIRDAQSLSNYLNSIASCRLIITLAFNIVRPGWKVESVAPGNASPGCFI